MKIKYLLTQPSTWRGIGLLLSLIGLNVPEELINDASGAVIFGLGVYEFGRDEYKKRT